MRQPADQRVHLPPRLNNPITRPAPMAISTAASGLRSIDASRLRTRAGEAVLRIRGAIGQL